MRRSRGERPLPTEGGFTLAELLIVMAVLGILAGIVVFALQGVSSSAAVAAGNSDFATVQTGISAYKIELGAFPAGVGSSVVTDNDLGDPPDFTAGMVPQGANVARAAGELLVASNASPNTVAAVRAGLLAASCPRQPGSLPHLGREPRFRIDTGARLVRACSFQSDP